MHYLDETHILLFLVQLFLLLLLTRALGEAFRRWGQPALTAELLVGVLLGPTILGRFMPGLHGALFPADLIQQNMLETIAWLGVLFMLLDTGLETDFSVAWRQRGSALIIAFSDIILPMVVAFLPCLFLPSEYLADPSRRLIFALFMATVMTISAMPVAARVLHDLNLLKADVGCLVMSALAVNDIVGWILFTIVLAFFTQAALNLPTVLLVFAGTVGFSALALTAGRYASTKALDLVKRSGLPEPGTSLTFACLLGLLFGSVTQGLGIHALFGFFIAGVVMGEARGLSQQTRGTISQMVYGLFVPVFFANIGLKLDFAANFDPFLVTFVSIIGVAGRYLGAWVGVSISKTPRINRDVISIAHTPGGMMEIVVALLALESGLIGPQVFVAIVFAAVLSSVIMGPWLRFSLNRRKAISLIDLLAKDAVISAVESDNRMDAIRELASRACAHEGSKTCLRIAEAIVKREHDFNSAIEAALAVPHVHMEGLRSPILAFGRAPGGIEWDAPDGKPVRHIFLLVTPAGLQDVHVQVLSQIARVMKDPANRAGIDAAEDASGLYDALERGFAQEANRRGKARAAT